MFTTVLDVVTKAGIAVLVLAAIVICAKVAWKVFHA